MDRTLDGEGVLARCERCNAVVSEPGVCAACMLREGLETDHFPMTQGDPFPADQSALRGRLIRQPIEDVPIVDGYEFHEEIGRGGMGVVYHAEQTWPIRRRVAIKLIKLGMDTKQVIGRFEAERQALAMMDHPNVARVLGAGASDTGRPYFVMEMVRGPKITDYCDRFKLSTRERLELFLQVCRAIQHAHQKGLIHRDIKPSNILVTQQDGAAVPKVIDFGIAKATGGISLTDKTVCTGVCEFLGTPAYTSPEQAVGGRDIDTRTDIYSLGVLLYELLTGCTPFDSNQLLRSGWEAMRRTIRETEPQRPSTRLTSLAPEELSRVSHRRRVESPRLIHLVRGDLDWIAMKCLEKERERRYSTCSGIIDDLERHLRHETVLARPPSAAYKVQKLVRRNALGFALGAVVATSILFAVGAAAWSLTKQAQARAMLRYFEKIHVIRDVLPGSRSGVGPVSAIAEIPHIPSIDWVNSLRVEPGGLRPGSALAMRLTSGALLGTNEVSLVQSANGEGVESTNNLALQSLLPASLAQSGTPGNEVKPAGTNGSSGALGTTYSQLAAAWWAWMMQLPLTNAAGALHPVYNTPFFDVTEGQSPGVWFLATPFGSLVRSCVIPPDTWIFLGMLNAESSNLEDPNEGFYGGTAAEQAAVAKRWADHVVNLHCEIDGVPVENLQQYRVVSPQFVFTAPTPWIYGIHGGTGTSVGDGYFLLISPFQSGQHTIRYGGAFEWRMASDGFEAYYPMEMTYVLTVP